MVGKPTGFLDLPPEIRNEIYTLLLPKHSTIMVYKRHRHGNAGTYNAETRGLLRLLRTNHQIYSEVAPVAYGAVTFDLTVSAGVVRWLRALGSMKQYIRHVYLDQWIQTNMRAFFHQLKQARYIQTITICPYIRSYVRAPVVAEALKTFIKTLKDGQQRYEAGDDVLKVIRAEYRRFVPSDSLKAEQQRADEYAVAIRAELKKLLA